MYVSGVLKKKYFYYRITSQLQSREYRHLQLAKTLPVTDISLRRYRLNQYFRGREREKTQNKSKRGI